MKLLAEQQHLTKLGCSRLHGYLVRETEHIVALHIKYVYYNHIYF